jgi:hypothetical protein
MIVPRYAVTTETSAQSDNCDACARREFVAVLSIKPLKPSFFFSSLGGVRLSPFVTSATNWPVVPAPDDR